MCKEQPTEAKRTGLRFFCCEKRTSIPLTSSGPRTQDGKALENQGPHGTPNDQFLLNILRFRISYPIGTGLVVNLFNSGSVGTCLDSGRGQEGRSCANTDVAASYNQWGGAGGGRCELLGRKMDSLLEM